MTQTTKKRFANPVTGKNQECGDNITLLGFDGTGQCVYQEYTKKGIVYYAGDAKKAAHFVDLK